MEDLRLCKACCTTKPVADFATYKRGDKRLPLRTCKECHREKERNRQRRYIAENREKHNRRSRDNKRSRYQADPKFKEELKARSQQYYDENKELILERAKIRYHDSKDTFRPNISIFRPREDDFDDVFDGLYRKNKKF